MKNSRSDRFHGESNQTEPPVFRYKFWENYFSAPRSIRVVCAFLVAVVWAAVLYPYQDTYYPEGNWLAGPLWLFKTRVWEDKMVGLIGTTITLPLIISFFIHPTRRYLWMSLIGAMLWIGIGFWVATLAAV